MTPPIPAADTWSQFPVVAVSVLVALVVVALIVGMMRWMADQERERREWQAAQDEKTQKVWRDFLAQNQREATAGLAKNTTAIESLSENVDKLMMTVASVAEIAKMTHAAVLDHDQATQARIDSVVDRIERRGKKPAGP